jgi:hypothetical protein
MALHVFTGGTGATSTIFPDTVTFSNISKRYCSYYSSYSNFNAFQSADGFLSNINFFAVRSNVQQGATNIDTLLKGNASIASSSNLDAYLAQLNTNILQLGYIANCVSEEYDVTDELYAAKKELELSKDRYDKIQFPEKDVSYYEGTFPIYRPINEKTLFILFAVGLFLMLLALVCFLRTQGIEINILVPQTTVTIPGMSTMYSISSSFSGQGTLYGFISIATVAAGCGILTGYLIYKYYT